MLHADACLPPVRCLCTCEDLVHPTYCKGQWSVSTSLVKACFEVTVTSSGYKRGHGDLLW
jgi:hypothetical protein